MTLTLETRIKARFDSHVPNAHPFGLPVHVAPLPAGLHLSAVAQLHLVRRRKPKMSDGIVSLTLGVFLLLVGGCGQKGGIEGEYVDVDSPDLSMIIIEQFM
jgi:hypothetical protein